MANGGAHCSMSCVCLEAEHGSCSSHLKQFVQLHTAVPFQHRRAISQNLHTTKDPFQPACACLAGPLSGRGALGPLPPGDAGRPRDRETWPDRKVCDCGHLRFASSHQIHSARRRGRSITRCLDTMQLPQAAPLFSGARRTGASQHPSDMHFLQAQASPPGEPLRHGGTGKHRAAVQAGTGRRCPHGHRRLPPILHPGMAVESCLRDATRMMRSLATSNL